MTTDEADIIETKSDERGRFRAAALRGRSYSLWARSQPEAGRYTGVQSRPRDVTAGLPVQLEQTAKPLHVRTIRIDNVESWKHEAPLRVTTLSLLENIVIRDLELDEGRRAQLPLFADHDRQDRSPGQERVADRRFLDLDDAGRSDRTTLCASRREEARVLRPRRSTARRASPRARIYQQQRGRLTRVALSEKDGICELL